MLEEKTIQFANFNITFGENEEAMLMLLFAKNEKILHLK